MKKISILSLCLVFFLITNQSSAQVSFNHSLGAFYAMSSTYTIKYKLDGVDYEEIGNLGGPGIVYNPRLNLFGGDKATLSVGAHVGLGFAFSANSQEGSSGSFVMDLPLMINLNMGGASSPDNTSGFGAFVGAGFGYNKMGSTESGIDYGGSAGPVFDGGIRVKLKERFYQLRLSYLLDMSGDAKTKKTIKDPKLNVFTIGVSRILGMRD